MGMTVSRLALPSGPRVFYSDRWTKLIEDHIDYLKEHANTQLIDLQPHTAYIYRYDFYGFLNSMSVPPEYHWCYLRVNDMHYPEQFDKPRTVWMPDSGTIEELRKRMTAT